MLFTEGMGDAKIVVDPKPKSSFCEVCVSDECFAPMVGSLGVLSEELLPESHVLVTRPEVWICNCI
jgi:hypothetical protein